MPASAAQPRYFTQPAQLAGAYALVDIAKGQSLTANLVATNPDLIPAGTPSYLPIPKGFIAMTLPTGEPVRFAVEAFARYCLLNGIDELGFLLGRSAEIEAYEARHP